MVWFLISTVFWGTALIKRRNFLKGGACSGLSVVGALVLIRGKSLFETRRLTETKMDFTNVLSYLKTHISYVAGIRNESIKYFFFGLAVFILRITKRFFENL